MLGIHNFIITIIWPYTCMHTVSKYLYLFQNVMQFFLNSVDPDQLASDEASGLGSALYSSRPWIHINNETLNQYLCCCWFWDSLFIVASYCVWELFCLSLVLLCIVSFLVLKGKEGWLLSCCHVAVSFLSLFLSVFGRSAVCNCFLFLFCFLFVWFDSLHPINNLSVM